MKINLLMYLHVNNFIIFVLIRNLAGEEILMLHNAFSEKFKYNSGRSLLSLDSIGIVGDSRGIIWIDER